MPMGLESLAASASTQTKTNSKSGSSATASVDEDLLEQLKQQGIEVNQPGEDIGLDFTDYLQLMVAQLQNQTMDNTMDSNAMLEQLVQMSTVQMMASLQTSMETIADATALNYAASLVGKTVTVGEVNDDGGIDEVVGEVTGTGTYQGTQVIFVNGEMYPLSNIMAVGKLPELPDEGGDTGESGTDGVEGTGGTEGAGTTDSTGSTGETTGEGGTTTTEGA